MKNLPQFRERYSRLLSIPAGKIMMTCDLSGKSVQYAKKQKEDKLFFFFRAPTIPALVAKPNDWTLHSIAFVNFQLLF